MVSRDYIFWEVDVQRDFMLPGGKLYVPGAEKLLPNIRRLTDPARLGKVFLVSHGCFHTPNDPEFSKQWGMAKIQAPLAWNRTHGQTGRLIAILDSGLNDLGADASSELLVLPFLAFFQMILAGLGRWASGLHPVNAILLVGLFGWLAYTLRQEQPDAVVATAPAAAPTG